MLSKNKRKVLEPVDFSGLTCESKVVPVDTNFELATSLLRWRS